MKVDPETVAAAKTGDRRAFDRLVRATHRETYTLAHRLTGNEHDALDVTQDAYLRAWRALPRFRGDAQFSTWLYRIVANCAANVTARRARQRTDELPADAPVADPHIDADPARTASNRADGAALASAVARMPAKLRQVLVLREVYDLPHRTIAERLGITEAATKVRLHRARRRLVADLTETGTAEAHGWLPASDEGGRRAS